MARDEIEVVLEEIVQMEDEAYKRSVYGRIFIPLSVIRQVKEVATEEEFESFLRYNLIRLARHRTRPTSLLVEDTLRQRGVLI